MFIMSLKRTLNYFKCLTSTLLHLIPLQNAIAFLNIWQYD